MRTAHPTRLNPSFRFLALVPLIVDDETSLGLCVYSNLQVQVTNLNPLEDYIPEPVKKILNIT